jgi:MFS family permease
MMTSICTSYYQFILAQGILGGISAGMTMSPAMAATGQYFNKKRAAALGMAVAGSSLGGVTFPIALGKMLYNPQLGFGWTVRICGFIMLAILAPACVGIRARLPPRKHSFFLPSAFKEAPYVAIIGASFLLMLGFFIPFFYLPTYAVEHGMSSELASYLISILNGASFFGRVIPGILADKLGRLNMLCVAAFCTGILIFCWPKITTNTSIIVFSALYGFWSGAIISLMSACLAQIPNDPRNIGTYMGMGMAVVSLAALIGPPINGALINRYNGFDQASIFSGAVVLVGGTVVLLTKQVSVKGLFGNI